MRSLFLKIKSLVPEKIVFNFFSNINFFKNINESEIFIGNKENEGDQKKEFEIPEIKDLQISDFTFNIKLKEDYHEERLIRNNYQITQEDRLKFLLEEKEIGQSLIEILRNENRIVILGSPGIGKTKELQNLFLKLWANKEESRIVPFYLNIKNFTSNTNFEDLINFQNWKMVDKPCFIIDGLDEISNISNFISKLEFFLNKHDNKEIKILVSCRTNVYEKFLVKISDSKHFFLESLTDRQIERLLKRNFNVDLTIIDLNKFRVFLENPFTLNLFGSYFQENGKFPNSISEAFKLSVDKELRQTKEKFTYRIDIDIPYFKKDLEKVAFVNELMQQNQIAEDHLSEIIERGYKPVFEELPFLDRLPESTNFVFRHKNYQEFFAAKFLADKNTDEIISIIKINDEINKTKPSLFNTITFLLNIIDDDKFEKIKDWLFNNEIEILFLAEKERIKPDIQKEIFRKYFTDIAFEKSFWFGRSRRFSMEKMAEFADVDFLLEVIQKNEHFRAVISAIDMFNYIDETDKEEEIKKIIINLIFKDKEYRNEALRTFKNRGYYLEKKLFEEIADFFKDDFDPEVNNQIIRIISDFENVDEYFPTLKNCLYKLYEIRPERIKDDVIRGTDFVLETIFFKIENSEDYIAVLNIIYNNQFTLRISNFYGKDFREKLIERSLFFIKKDSDFLFRIVDAFLRSKDYLIYRRDNFLFEVITKSSKVVNSFKYIVNKHGINDNTILLLSNFQEKQCIDYLAEKYQNGTLNLKEKSDINYLRNRFFMNCHELGYYYEEKLSAAGYVFEEPLPSKEQIEKDNKEYKTFVQANFEILFDKEKLKEKIAKVFDENKVDEMSWQKIHDISRKWYKVTNYHGSQNSVFSFIQNRVRNRNKTKEQILGYVDRDINLLYEIKHKIKDRSSEGFEVRPEHIEYIRKESLIAAENFDHNNVLEIVSDDRTIFKNGYHILKMLYFFDKEYDIHYKKEFYLQTLKYCNIHGSADGNFEFIFERINDKAAFDEMIIRNINQEQLDYSSLNDHIDYAITNKLQDCYEKIGDFILYSNYIPADKEFLIRFVDLLSTNEQFEYLKKCCENSNKYLCWRAVEVMKEKNIGKDFMLNLAKDYIASGEEYYFSNALALLFYFNDLEALDIYLNFLRKFGATAADLRDDFLVNTSNFKNFEKLNLLKEIFDIIYDEKNIGSFDYHHSKANLENLISNISKTEEGYNVIQKILTEIKSEIKDKGSKFFYINHLIDSSEQTYYNSVAKPLTFLQAKDFVK